MGFERSGKTPPRRRSRARTISPRLGWILLWLAGLLGLWILTLLVLRSSERLMPGARVLERPLGWRGAEDAVQRLDADWRQLRIAVDLPEAALSLAPEELGLGLDAPATVLEAWRAGRDRQRGLAMLQPWSRYVVTPVILLDLDPAVTTLQGLVEATRRPPVDARLRLAGGRVEILPAIEGAELDVMASSVRLQAEPERIVAARRFEPVLRSLAPDLTDAASAAESAGALLAQTLTLQLWDPVDDSRVEREIPAGTWADWVDLGLEREPPARPRWSVRPEGIRDHLGERIELEDGRFAESAEIVERLPASLGAGRAELRLRLRHPERQHAVESGETIAAIGRRFGIPYPWILAANPGAGDQLRAGQLLRIPPADRFLELPIVEGKRIVVDLGQQRTRVYEGGALRWEWPSSSGVDESPTAPGAYQVTSLEREAYASAWELNMPYFIGLYRPAPGASVVNGFHGLPVHDRLGPLWGGLVGTRATYGCIMLDNPQAAELFAWAEPGVIVEIREAVGP